MKLKMIGLLAVVAVFFINAGAQTVTLKQIGKSNLLNPSFFDYVQGQLYTMDNNGAIYKTDLGTGEHTRVGKDVYSKTKFFFAKNNMLYIIENDGSMQQINPANGNGVVVASMGTWDRIEKVFVVHNAFYAIEGGSLFYYPVLNPNSRRSIGGNDFYSMGLLMRTDTAMYSLIDNGTLYQIDLRSGKKNRVGAAKAWKAARAGAVLNNKLYTAENPSSLFECDLANPEKKELDNKQFERPRFMFSDNGKLYFVHTNGTLYEVVMQ